MLKAAISDKPDAIEARIGRLDFPEFAV